MDFLKKTFLVVGTGMSGIAAAELLLQKGAKTYLYDGNAALDKQAFREKNKKLEQVPLLLETIPSEILQEIDIAVLSPGVPLDSLLVEELKRQQVLIWGEIELAYRLGNGRVAAITGTNGKTTTTSLVGHIMSLQFPEVKVVGNIGIPYTKVVDELREDSLVVAEISSFQLETIEQFAPKVSAILNITPDHLNRHHTMENYIAAKESITKNQKAEDCCVLNYEDEVLREFGNTLSQKVIYFSSERVLPEGLFLQNGNIIWKQQEECTQIIPVKELNILGKHNYENAMAAAAICREMGISLDVIRRGLSSFHAVEHRIEYVCDKKGISFYNDSKGTNPDAAIKGIQAMDRKTLLIGGGYDKASAYDEWIESFDGKVKKLILLGQTKEKIAQCCEEHGFCDYVFVDTLEEAIDVAYQNAISGEAVLLSPACASWGMFDNYQQRGNRFKDYVKQLKE